jgi:hypothetical protein
MHDFLPFDGALGFIGGNVCLTGFLVAIYFSLKVTPHGAHSLEV